MHVSILDHIRHRKFDLSRSLKVKCDDGLDSPYMISYWCLIVTYGLNQLPYEIYRKSLKSEWPWLWPFKVTRSQRWWCHWTLHICFPIDILNRMSISHRLAVIAIQNGFSYLLSLDPNYEKSKVHRMTSKWHWMLQGQRYPIYVELPHTSPKFHSVLFYDRWFSW